MTLVHVEWRDAGSVDAWTPFGDIDISAPICESIGFLVRWDDDAIAVAGSINGGNACCVMIIPRAVIKRISEVKMGGEWQTGLRNDE